MSVAAPIVLRPGDESRFRTVLRCSTAAAGVAQRARIVLLAAEGVSNAEIGRRVGVSRPTVLTWRGRYEQSGIAGLGDLDRSGRPPVIDDLAVVVATLAPPPASLGVTHWSARLLGTHLGISFASVARIWREHDLKPWKRETFKSSTDPELDAKVRSHSWLGPSGNWHPSSSEAVATAASLALVASRSTWRSLTALTSCSPHVQRAEARRVFSSDLTDFGHSHVRPSVARAPTS